MRSRTELPHHRVSVVLRDHPRRLGGTFLHQATSIGVLVWTVAVLAIVLLVGCPAATAAESHDTRRPARSAGSPVPGAESLGDRLDAFRRAIVDAAQDGSIAPVQLAPPDAHLRSERLLSAAAGPLFHPYVTYPVSDGTNALAIGDVTGDGLNDVVAVQASLDAVYVFSQSPSGMLNPPVRYPAPITYLGTFSGSVDIADMNHDGRLDVVVSLDNAVGVMLQIDSGLLSGPVAYATAHSSFSNTYKVRTGDFNNDGQSDAVSIDWGTQSHDVDVFLQTPGGGLTTPHVYTVIHGGYDDLAVGDVSGDGLFDIVVMSGQSFVPNFGVLIQSQTGSFNPPAYYSLGGNQLTSGVGIGDVNHDGRSDVVVSYGGNGPSANIGVFLQDGAGHLGPVFSLPSYDIPQPVELGDVNLDGRDDVVTLHGGWLALGVYLQNGSGALQPEELYPVPYASHYNRHALAIGDLNGDFMPDVAIADPSAGVVVLYNAQSLPTPVLISLVSAEAFSDRVELAWEVDADPGATATIERSDTPGTWREIGMRVVDGAHRVHFTDRDVEAGSRYGYRLGLLENRVEGFAGEVWVDVATVGTLALHGSRPNPSSKRLNVWFALPIADVATLELLDLTGRRIVSREVGTLGAGMHFMDMTPERPLVPGVYWLRLTQGSDVRTTKAAVVK